ncbi:GNAT family N-acetyltransferase [Cellulomonas taurus]|uniref:GNAT family N-acetyltransferase n=1 Tax=Cellulomonas taurus TaxID=2729175 RepID=UPI00145FB53F|nr:GNAT family N-acetyltransferase [Cellulomonas taurus]
MTGDLTIEVDDLTRPAVHVLLAEHLSDMRAGSPPESVHALDVDQLRHPSVTMVTAWVGTLLLGCGALKDLGDGHGELKSMRTTVAARGRGIGAAVLTHLIELADARGMRRLSLETGAEDQFAPARRLYARHGFVECAPFADYRPDPLSVFMTREV